MVLLLHQQQSNPNKTLNLAPGKVLSEKCRYMIVKVYKQPLQFSIIIFSIYNISGIDISGSCKGTNRLNGYIISPNYPQKYGNGIDCRWLISSTVGSNLTLTFLDFETESSRDIVKVYDGKNIYGKLLSTYSGSFRSFSFDSTTNDIYLRFTSDSYTTYRGFRIQVSGNYKFW